MADTSGRAQYINTLKKRRGGLAWFDIRGGTNNLRILYTVGRDFARRSHSDGRIASCDRSDARAVYL